MEINQLLMQIGLINNYSIFSDNNTTNRVNYIKKKEKDIVIYKVKYDIIKDA